MAVRSRNRRRAGEAGAVSESGPDDRPNNFRKPQPATPAMRRAICMIITTVKAVIELKTHQRNGAATRASLSVMRVGLGLRPNHPMLEANIRSKSAKMVAPSHLRAARFGIHLLPQAPRRRTQYTWLAIRTTSMEAKIRNPADTLMRQTPSHLTESGTERDFV